MKKHLPLSLKGRHPLSRAALLSLCLCLTGPSLMAGPEEAFVLEQAVQAEKIAVEGRVVDSEDGSPLPGVSIAANGKPVGVTNLEGHFKLDVEKGAKLSFTYIGYRPTSVTVNQPEANLSVQLETDNQQLSEVVVTALGIKREEKSLGYALTKVSGDEISKTAPTNWMNGLAGKVPGLNMTSAGAGPGGSVRLVLRGQNSLDMSKGEALIVVDGVPINGGAQGNSGQGYMSDESSVDYGNGASDINPEDIESVSVLRGASATALYGSRAGAGAIVITTKSGQKKKGLGITVSSSAAIDDVLRWPDYQSEYGQGQRSEAKHYYYSYGKTEDGASNISTHTWGPKFDGQLYYQYDPVTNQVGAERTPWVGDENYIKDFFRTGTTFTNSVSLRGGDEKNSYSLSFTDLRNKYIIPNTGFNRNSVALSSSHDLNKFQINTKINYYNKNSDNLPLAGYSSRSFMYAMIWTHPNIPVDWYRNYWEPGEEGLVQNNQLNGNLDNPFFSLYENLNTVDKKRIFGNLSVTYSFNDKLSLMLRSGLDMDDELRTSRRAVSSVASPNGWYKEQVTGTTEINNDFMLKYDEKLGDKIGLSLTVGGNNMSRKWKNNTAIAERLNFPGIYKLANSQDRPYISNKRYEKELNSLYGLAQFSYGSKIFVDVTGRNDWSSTLPSGNNSYFYPSVNTSFVLSELFDFSSIGLLNSLSFAKLRASIAQVGNDTDPFQTQRYYSANEIGGSYTNPTVLPNLDLKPEMITSREVGLDVRFFSNRIGLDVTYYNSDTKNQIIAVPTDPASGYYSRMFNAGLINNSGWEIGFNAIPVDNAAFKWNTYATWSKNKNEVVELAEGVETIILSQGPRGYVQATVGGTIGDIYGAGLARTPDGQVIYDESGYPVLDNELKYQGSSIPDWKASWGNQFTYKNLSFSFLFDGQLGGKVYSLTHSMLAYSGKLKKTIPGRYDGLIGEGVQVNADGSYRPNDVRTKDISFYYNALYQRDNVEMNTFDTSFIKLREARLQFALPKRWFRANILQNATVSVYGRNLLLFTDFPSFDPEVATLNDGRIEPGFETAQLPSTRTFGTNLTLSF